MSEKLYTGIIKRLASGMGLRYTYFSQGNVNSKNMHSEFEILGDFKGKGQESVWGGGVCFGLSALYLGCSTPTGRSTWKTSKSLMSELNGAITGSAKSAGMLNAIAQAFVRQKGASAVRRSTFTNPKVILCSGCSRQYPVSLPISECLRCGSKNLKLSKLRDTDLKSLARLSNTTPEALRQKPFEKAHKTTQKAYLATLNRYRAKERKGNTVQPELEDISDKHKHAIRDQLMANFSLKPNPRHDKDGVRQNYKIFGTNVAEPEFLTYKNHLNESEIEALLEFCGKKNTFSLVGYERVMREGHQMAIWGGGSRVRFFDPNFGVVSFSYSSGLKTFLSRYLAYLYCWKGVGNPPKQNSSVFMSQKSFGNIHWNYTSLDLEVYRYSL